MRLGGTAPPQPLVERKLQLDKVTGPPLSLPLASLGNASKGGTQQILQGTTRHALLYVVVLVNPLGEMQASRSQTSSCACRSWYVLPACVACSLSLSLPLSACPPTGRLFVACLSTTAWCLGCLYRLSDALPIPCHSRWVWPVARGRRLSKCDAP
jgi:hypothetical protein